MKQLSYLLILLSFNAFSEVVYTLGPQKSVDISHDFFVQLLELALQAGEEEQNFPIDIRTKPYSGQGRVLRLLGVDKYYDIVWSANTVERNQSLLPIPFPLFKGGLGLRGFVIRKADEAKFRSFFNFDDLKNIVICQGRHWPDSIILKDAGLNIEEITHFDAMLAMVSMGRCDAVALSIFEGEAELKAMHSDFQDLTFFTEVVLHYELVMNFYVNKDNKILANRVLKGLLRLNDAGDYDRLLNEHKLTKDVVAAWNVGIHRVINIPNMSRTDITEQMKHFSPMVQSTR